MNQVFSLSIDDIADHHQVVLTRSFYVVALLIIGLCFYHLRLIDPLLFLVGGVIVLLCLLPSYLWCTRKVLGTPIVPALCLNEIVWFALPIFSGHGELQEYSSGEIIRAGIMEVLFLGTLILIWYRYTKMVPVLPEKILAIPKRVVEYEGMDTIWLTAYVASSLYTMANTAGFLDSIFLFLPGGVYSMVRTLVSTVAILSIFFLSMGVGARQLSKGQRYTFYLFYVLHLAGMASSILLVSILPLVLSFIAGFTLGRGKLPIFFLVAVALTINVLHAAKWEMRERYWPQFAGTAVNLTPFDYPGYYHEWISQGWDNLTAPEPFYGTVEEDESILARTSIVQMLLYAQRRAPEHIPYLMGETLVIIPKLMIPRVFWPGKPRTHEGQVILNVKFGRQDYNAASTTYIAWGMLAELYANFGPLGSIILGIFLGVMFGYVTKLSIEIPTGSFRFLVSLIFLVAGINATQTSLAVWITSIFQTLVVVYFLCLVVMNKRALEDYDEDDDEEELAEEDGEPDVLLWQN